MFFDFSFQYLSVDVRGRVPPALLRHHFCKSGTGLWNIGETTRIFLFLIMVSPGIKIKELHLPFGSAPNSEVQAPGGRKSARLTLKALVLSVHTSVWMCGSAQEDGFLMRVSLSLTETSESDLFCCPLEIHSPQTSQYHSKSGIFSRTQVIYRYGSSSGRFGKTSSSDQLLSTCFLTVLFTSL